MQSILQLLAYASQTPLFYIRPTLKEEMYSPSYNAHKTSSTSGIAHMYTIQLTKYEPQNGRLLPTRQSWVYPSNQQVRRPQDPRASHHKNGQQWQRRVLIGQIPDDVGLYRIKWMRGLDELGGIGNDAVHDAQLIPCSERVLRLYCGYVDMKTEGLIL